jgi:two-component sensor histidine kinase
LSLAAWTVPALLATLETVTFARQSGHPIPAWRAFVGEAPQWYAWALFTPFILRLVDRWPIDGFARLRNLSVHVIACLCGSAMIAIAQAITNAWVRPTTRSLASSSLSWFLGELPATTVAYFAIVGVAHALRSRDRWRERERRAAELEAQLKEAQLAALRMQLQPHFLFNSLNAISALVRDHETDAATRALTLLGDLLRTTTSTASRHESTLGEEVDFIGRYLELERVRFGERLRVAIDVPPELTAARVPTLLLQPFVENALKHGVLRDREGNSIAIAARRVDGTLRVTVRDDGRGLGQIDPTTAGGVGIANSRTRLAHMYGDRARLTVIDAAPHGVEVDIQLPLSPLSPLSQ